MNTMHFKNILFVYLLFVLTVVVHFSTLLNGIINWRDDELFFALHSLSVGASSVFSHQDHAPAMMLWYGVQYMIGGDGYFIYHAVSLLLHTANAILLFVLLMRFGVSSLTAGAAAFVFAVHPIHVESLAMVSHQGTLLSMLLLQLVMVFYAVYLQHGKRRYLYLSIAVSVLFFLVGFHAAYIIAAVLFLRIGSGKAVTGTSLALFILLWTASLLAEFRGIEILPYFRSLVSDSLAMVRFGYADQGLRMLFPWFVPLLPDTVPEAGQRYTYISILIPFAVVSLVVLPVLLRKRFPVIFYGCMTILLTSVPLMTGLHRGEWTFSEDGAYIASAGWIVILIWIAGEIVRMISHSKVLKLAAYGVAGFVIVLFIVRTAVKSSYWENGGIYWQHVLDEKPDHVFALIKKGMYHYFRYEIDPSLKALNRAVELAPDDYETNYSRGVVHLGAMLLPEATRDYRKALKADMASSNAHFGIGSIHSLYSRYDSAVIAYSEAIRYSPKFYEAYTNRGTVYGGMGKYVQSYADYRQAQMINPAFGQLYGNRALITLQIGNAQSAAVDFGAQIALEPNQVHPRIHAAFTSLLLGDTTAAILQFSQAREIDSLRTKLYLSTAFETFLKTRQEIEQGKNVLRKVFGNY